MGPHTKSKSPYKGGVFHFNLTLPENFPFKAPSVRLPRACPPPVHRLTKDRTVLWWSGHVHDQDLSSWDQRGGPNLRARPARPGACGSCSPARPTVLTPSVRPPLPDRYPSGSPQCPCRPVRLSLLFIGLPLSTHQVCSAQYHLGQGQQPEPGRPVRAGDRSCKLARPRERKHAWLTGSC